MNGLPYWCGHGVAALGATPLDRVDPDGLIAAALPCAQVLGCVVHASTSVAEPGLVSHKMCNGLIIGEAAGGGTPRAQQVSALLRHAGFDVKVSDNSRYDICYKM
jgi:2-dehydropantoate 2-reductase